MGSDTGAKAVSSPAKPARFKRIARSGRKGLSAPKLLASRISVPESIWR